MATQLWLPLGDEIVTFRRALGWVLESHECRPKTLLMHASHAGYLLDGAVEGGARFGDVDVRRIGYPEIVAWMKAERSRGLAKETCKKRLSTLRLALLECVARRVIERLPQWPKIRTDTRRSEGYWTYEQFQQAIAACDDDDLAAWITVGFFCGLHASDIDQFRWEDVHWARGTWTRRNSKTGVPPTELPLPAEFRTALVERQHRAGRHARQLVSTHPMGYPNRQLAEICDAAGVPRISTIGLRHSCESWLASRGVPTEGQVLWLGLTSPRMLAVYCHVSPARIAEFFPAAAVA